VTAPLNRIVAAAMRLRAHSSDDWNEFVSAMREYAAATASDMVGCQPELLLKAQGMAYTANVLAMTLNNAPAIYEKIRNNG
jgi:hypothetical protein